MSHKRLCSLALIFAVCGFIVNAADYTVRRVVDLPIKSAYWDFTKCEAVGDEFDYKVDDVVGYTRVWSPVERFDFKEFNDTVIQSCDETRQYRAMFMPGIVKALPGGQPGTGMFTVKGRIQQSHFFCGSGISTVSQPQRVGFTSLLGEQVDNATLYHDVQVVEWCVSDDSTMVTANVPADLLSTTTIESYRLMAPYEQFPRAYKRVKTTRFDNRIVEADSIAWILSYVPGSNTNRELKPHFGDDEGDNEYYQNSMLPGRDVVVTMGNGVLSIAGGEHEAPVRLVLTDVLGRVCLSQNVVIGREPALVTIDNLSSGEYLLQLYNADNQAIYVHKIVK